MIWLEDPPPHKKKKKKITRYFVLFSPQLILVITATSGDGVFFQASALFCKENVKFQPVIWRNRFDEDGQNVDKRVT